MESNSIKIVSLDIQMEDIQSVVDEAICQNEHVKAFMEERETDKSNDSDNIVNGRYIKNTHCTFAHRAQMSQEEIRSKFSHMIGAEATVHAVSFLYDENVAALEISIPSTTSGDPALPVTPPMNKFPHVTVWCGKNIEAWRSNTLPAKVINKEATKVVLKSPIELKGRFGFWE